MSTDNLLPESSSGEAVDEQPSLEGDNATPIPQSGWRRWWRKKETTTNPESTCSPKELEEGKKEETMPTPSTSSNVPKNMKPSKPFCRVCYQRSPSSSLVTPCRCTGTMSWIHMSCLEKWLTESQSSSCELCMTKYVCKVRYSSMISWICSCPRQLMSDFALVLFLAPLGFISVFLCLKGAITEFNNDNRFQSFTLFFMGFFLGLVSVTWIGLSARNHWSTFNEFRRLHPIRSIDLALTLEQIAEEDRRKKGRKESTATTHTIVDLT